MTEGFRTVTQIWLSTYGVDGFRVDAAAHLIESLGAERVAIVDWDAHHGNGAQGIGIWGGARREYAAMKFIMIVLMTSWPPRRALSHPGTAPHKAPKANAARWLMTMGWCRSIAPFARNCSRSMPEDSIRRQKNTLGRCQSLWYKCN